jgi:Type II CAAX prenyl endopeptidase Rce1-like
MTFSAKTHYLALIFAIILIVLIALTFITFGFGAYMVFNHPNSYVVAKTTKTTSGAILQVQASNLENNTQRTVWIDPQFSTVNSTLLVQNSGFPIANVTTNSAGNIFVNLTLSNTTLHDINTDDQSPHSVWIVGVSGVVTYQSGTFLNTTTDTEVNYTASTLGSPYTTNFFWISLFGLASPVSATLGQLFIAVWTIYLMLFAVALNGPFQNIVGSMKEIAAKGLDGVLSNSALATFMVFPVALWGSALLALLQQSAGIPTGSLPPADPLLEFVELAVAPLREEIGFRVIPIGIFALIILLSKNRIKDGLLALWHPSKYLKKNEAPAQYRRDQLAVYVLIVISAIIFGAAHVLHGWDIGKLSQAAGVGLAFGVLYYQYGFAATVLLHWQFDYVVGVYTETTNPVIVNTYTYYGLATEVAAVASTIALIILLVRKIRKPHIFSPNPAVL